MSLKNTQIHAILLLWSSIVAFVSSIHTVSSISVNNPSNYNAEKQELVELFEHWMKEHEKIYVQPEDKARAFKNFVKNVEYVREWNANKEKGSHVLGLNNFADLSMEEFNGKYWSNTLRKKRRQLGNKMSMKRKQKSCHAPASFDWRTHGVVSRVKDQGYICGKVLFYYLYFNIIFCTFLLQIF
jgi:Cathepsin propeptide inhibitor domain (I29)